MANTLLPQRLSLYSKEQARRNDVRPGITGWAQVNGRNAISWTKKFGLWVIALFCKMPIIAATDVNTDIGTLATQNGYGYCCESRIVDDFTRCINK